MRVIGFTFLVLFVQHKLPAIFALPIGLGDTLVGISAPFVAYWYFKGKSGATRLAVALNIFGMSDIIVAGILGVLDMTSTIQLIFTFPNVDLMTYFPLILYPVYGMPLVVFVHLLPLNALLRKSALKK